jgi:hypothetical protein
MDTNVPKTGKTKRRMRAFFEFRSFRASAGASLDFQNSTYLIELHVQIENNTKRIGGDTENFSLPSSDR